MTLTEANHLVVLRGSVVLVRSWVDFTQDVSYCWQELPQVNFLSQWKFCHNRACLLSWQKYACHDKTFVKTKLCLSQLNFCHNNFFMTNTCFCHNKRCILSWQTHVCCEKTMLVVTKLCLLWQNFTKLCHNNYLSWQQLCCGKIFCHNKHNSVATNLLSQQAYFCYNKRRDKNDTCDSSCQW